MTPIGVRFTVSPEEYAGAVRQAMVRQPILLVIGALMLGGILTPLWASLTGAEAFTALTLGMSGGCLAGLIYLFGVSPTSAYKKLNPANRDQEQEFRCTDDGMEIRHATAEAKLDWKTWVKFRETNRFFMLYQAQELMTILPKRAFTGPGEILAFRELLKRKIPVA